MFDLDRWEEIFETIRKNKLRTFLTGLSVLSGIFILVVLLGIGEGIQNGIEHQFQNDAENRISIWPGRTSVDYKGLNKDRRIQFKNKDYDLVVRKFEDNLEYKSSLYRVWRSMITYKSESGNYRIESVYPDYQFLENQTMVEGRYLNPTDLNNYSKVAVIGEKMKKELFGKATATGEYIMINGINFKVIGVYSDPGGDRAESRVAIPITTGQRVFNGGDQIRSMSFTLPTMENFDQALAASEGFITDIERQLKQTHTVAPNDNSAISINNTLKEAKRIYFMISSIKIFFWFVGIATLLAGVVGVGNVMLIIVKERTKEIGIRKALGAKPNSIIWMILHEAIFITAIAGFLGLFLGMVLLDAVGPMIKSDFLRNPAVNFQVAVATVVILVIAGTIAGFFPARRAARIKPIDALTDE
ncbi:MAG TPA: ABC transporter permease [Flavobacteriaceae bacterium]|nr:ABC transporter permease [Flavobacteriaceae bacterium]